MRYSSSFLNTSRQSATDADSVSHDLIVRAGLAHQVSSGQYSLLTLGTMLLRKIENIVREEMSRAGAAEVLLNILQSAALFEESGRSDTYGKEMFKLKNRNGKDFFLSATAEEAVVDLVRAKLKSYKELGFTLFQIGTKFRDELRARGGLIRTKEFIMKDAYSFDVDEDGLDRSYQTMRQAYLKIFARLGLKVHVVKADSGQIGGAYSEEFIAESAAGEDKFVIGEDGVARKVDDLDYEVAEDRIRTGIEVGHIFKLGTVYSKKMNLRYAGADGIQRYVVMGCYGIGVSRLIAAIIEQNHDERGIVLNDELRLFDAAIITIGGDSLVRETAEALYEGLLERGVRVLYDDREVSAGVKFKDADLIGAHHKLIVSARTVERGVVECERRSDSFKQELQLDTAVEGFRALEG